jgi:5'-nucleotidase
VTASRPLRIRPATVARFDAHRVDGTPADCVALGSHLFGPVDVVLSGINLGLNVGNAMWHSGTLAAAKQAVLLGMRGVALSAPAEHDPPDYAPILPWLDEVLDELLAGPASLVNVNFPSRPRGIVWTRQSVRRYDGRIMPAHDPFGRALYWFAPMPLEAPDANTDRWAVDEGLVSLTPLRLDLTDHRALERAVAAE